MTCNTCKICKRCHNLLACCKSNKVPEESLPQVKRSPQASALDTSTQIYYDDFFSDESLNQNIQHTEANDWQAISAGGSTEYLNFPSLTSDSAVIGDMVSLSATCPPILETIFSPVFEQNETQFTLDHSNSAVEGGHPDLPQLVSIDSNDARCTSTDAKSFNCWDFCNSEVASAALDGDIGFSDFLTTAYQDYGHILSDMIIDKEDTDMALPLFEKAMDIGSICDDISVEEAMRSSDDSLLYLAIHQLTSKPATELSYNYCDLDEMEFDPQLFLRNLPDLLEANWLILPKETRKRKPVTLVLDLDETLVHSTLEHCDDADFTFPVFFNMKQHTVYVRRRPHLQTFLERVADMFEVVIFTASQSIYAEQLLDILDPDKKLISHRMYRESCIFSNGNCTKDLTILGLDLAKVAIVDNTPQVFQLQVNNGIPIKSWFDDPSDEVLISLLPFLETLSDADDVRPIIAKRFSHEE